MADLQLAVINLSLLALCLYWPLLLLATSTTFAFFAARQEAKAHRNSGDELGLSGFLKCMVATIYWAMGSAVGSAVLLPIALLRGGVANNHRFSNTIVTRLIGKSMMRLFAGPVVVVGRENLPAEDGFIVAMNHQSQLDIMAAYSLDRYFSWISKKVVGMIPGIGTVMWLAGDVLIERRRAKDAAAQRDKVSGMFKQVQDKLASGASVFIFPQGTRERNGTLPFKHGAFTMAMNSEVAIVPVSVDIAAGAWRRSFLEILSPNCPPAVTLTVHPAIAATAESDKEQLTVQTYQAIYSTLPKKAED